MSLCEKLGFDWDSSIITSISPANNSRKPVFILKKMLEEYVWDITHLEDNPYTFVEVQTLISGITVGGYSLHDQIQVLNQEKALKRLVALTENELQLLSKQLVLDLHALVAYEEALSWGQFRDGQVGIGGTSHQPPSPDTLEGIFDLGVKYINTIESPVERALVYFFWGAMNQFFYDGNKRTSRCVMNYILMSSGYYYLTVPANKKDEFNRVMVDFYDTKCANNAMQFLCGCFKNWD